MNKNKEIQKNAIYFKSLTIENLNCFKGEHTFDFSENENKHAQWTVILGNNNTGKTTILRALAVMEILKNKKGYIPDIVFNDDNEFSVFSNLFIKDKITYVYRTWGYSDIAFSADEDGLLNKFIIYGYGTRRKASKKSLSDTEEKDTTLNLFDENVELTNAEEWLMQLDYAIKNKSKIAEKRLKKVKEILTSDILPDIIDFEFVTDEKLDSYVLFKTDYGKIRYNSLGFGYQVTIAWIIDLVKKMFERYPDSKEPLHEPAIVLVDEIDLHLHPEWQRKIIKFVGNLFPNTQFIATTHSPLVIQSADKINVIVLLKDGDHINVKQPEISTYKGWSVEEILSELMELGDRVKSEDYLKLIKQFGEALDNNDKEKAEDAYNELDKILSPMTHQRKLLEIQMTSLTTE